MKPFLISALFLLTLISPAQAENIAVRLGSVQVAERTDKDVINLPPCKGKGNIKVNSLQIRVSKKPVQVDKLKVVFYNGESQLLTVKKHFKPGQQSRWIDLKGEARCIQKIVFIGDTDTKGFKPKKQSSVAVFGKANTKQATTANTPSKDKTEGIRLGSVRLGEEKEKTSLKLPPCNSKENIKVSKVRLVVKDHPAEINRIKVIFYNGDEQFFPVNKHLKVNSPSPWVDLKGDQRCIKRIVFVGDADTPGFRPGKQAKIVVHGKK